MPDDRLDHLSTHRRRRGREADVHAMTDVTGFGVLGHALEMAQAGGACVRLEIDRAQLPYLEFAEGLAEQGLLSTRASGRNWASYGGMRSSAVGAGGLAARGC